jgi:hypothetical protein
MEKSTKTTNNRKEKKNKGKIKLCASCINSGLGYNNKQTFHTDISRNIEEREMHRPLTMIYLDKIILKYFLQKRMVKRSRV